MTWNDLSMSEKAAMIKVAVQNGIYKLDDVRNAYNEYAKGGPLSDKDYYAIMEKVAKENWQTWGDSSEEAALTRILNDNSFNYRDYYNENPFSRANADTHWTDKYKTAYHPTFGKESKYSGKQSEYNPLGIKGGTWGDHSYTLSEDQVNNDWDVRNIAEYLTYAENNGVSLRYPKGELPVFDGVPWGGVLPTVKITPHKSNQHNTYPGGGGLDSRWKKVKLQASSDIMHYLSNNVAPADERDIYPMPPYTPSTYDDTAEGMAQATYLLNRDDQHEAFLNKGYVQGLQGDYGLVNKAATATNKRRGEIIPVFMTQPNEVDRDDLIHISNRLYQDEKAEDIVFNDPKRRLVNAESYPVALYIGTDGKPYGKGWDLNDYGLYDGQPDNYHYGWRNIGAKALDLIGSPTVVTTGYGRVYPTKEQDAYARKHGLRWSDNTESYYGSAPEVVITPTSSHALGGKLFDIGGSVVDNANSQYYTVPIEDATDMYLHDVQAWNDLPQITITPNGYSVQNPAPEARYFKHTSNGSVPVFTSTKDWQNYWGRKGKDYMNNAMEKTGGLGLGLTGLAVAPAIGSAFAGMGDAVMMAGDRVVTNPYFNAALTSSGVADAGNKIVHGQVGNSLLQDALTALEFAPLGNMMMKAKGGYGFLEGVNETWKDVEKAHPIVGQAPRYVMGKFKYGFDAQLPQLIRRTENPLSSPSAFSRQVYWTNPNPRFAHLDLTPSPVITNMTTDQSVLSHGIDSWEGFDYNILPGKYLLGKHVISTKPMDTFTFGDVWKVPKKAVTTISGKNPDSSLHSLYTTALDNKESKDLYEQALQAEAEKVLKHPTAKDYQFMDYVFRPQYTSDVVDKAALNGKSMKEVFPEDLPITLREVISNTTARNHLFNDKLWHNVYYDPIPDVEARFRDEHGIELINILKKQRPK